jgi:hypothetical protein
MTRLLPWKTPILSVILGTFAVVSMTCTFRGHSFITGRFAGQSRNSAWTSACPLRIPSHFHVNSYCRRESQGSTLSYACSLACSTTLVQSSPAPRATSPTRFFSWPSCTEQTTANVLSRVTTVRCMTRYLHHLTSTSKIQQAPFQPTVSTHTSNPYSVPYSVTEWRKQPVEGTPAPW